MPGAMSSMTSNVLIGGYFCIFHADLSPEEDVCMVMPQFPSLESLLLEEELGGGLVLGVHGEKGFIGGKSLFDHLLDVSETVC